MENRILRRLGCGILVLALVIGISACASKPENGASENFKVDLPSGETMYLSETYG